MITEADTCRRYVLPKLYEAGWSDDQISEQKTFTDGKIVVLGDKVQRRKTKRADYILRISRNVPIAVIEAKAAYKDPGDGLQQAKEYAEILGLKFAYSTNGHGIIEHDYITGLEKKLARLPTPKELWNRLKENEGITLDVEDKLLTPYYALLGKQARYYQEKHHIMGALSEIGKESTIRVLGSYAIARQVFEMLADAEDGGGC